MNSATDRLVRHLVIAVVLKLAVLAVLWWAFVRNDRVGMDTERAAAHLGAPLVADRARPDLTGAQP